jgi:hypothetical protein
MLHGKRHSPQRDMMEVQCRLVSGREVKGIVAVQLLQCSPEALIASEVC